MSRYKKLMARIEAGEQIIIDGATGTEMERRGVPQLDNAWTGSVGVYAHSGDYINGKWIFSSVINAEDYTVAAEGSINRGVRVVGGCCGIGPEHIHRLKGLCQGTI